MITRRTFLAASSASLANAKGPALAAPAKQLVKPACSDFLTFHPQFVNNFRSPSPNLTFSSLYNLESSFDWIRLIYRNDMRDDETIDGAAIAPTAMWGDGFTAFNAEGKPDASLWKRVTFASGGDDQPPHPSKDGSSETIRIGGDATWGRNPPPPSFSDWIPIDPSSELTVAKEHCFW